MSASKTERVHELSLKAITIDPTLQSRVSTDMEDAKSFSEAMLRGDIFPPVDVVRDQDSNYWLYNGFHRYHGAKNAGLKSIRARIIEGTKQDAYVLSAGSNKEFSKKRSPEDIKKACLMLFALPEWWGRSDTAIGRHVGTTSKTVARHRAEYSQTSNVPMPTVIVNTAGRTVPKQERIGRNRAKTEHYEIHVGDRSAHTRVDGRHIASSPTPDGVANVKARADAITQARRLRTRSLVHDHIRKRLATRGVHVDFYKPSSGHTNFDVCGAYSFGVAFRSHDFKQPTPLALSIGQLALASAHKPGISRSIIVAYTDDGSQKLVELAQKAGVEFMTPDELIELLVSISKQPKSRVILSRNAHTVGGAS